MVANFTMRRYGVNQVFQFMKAICYIERVAKSDFFSEKNNFTFYVRKMFWATIFNKYHADTTQHQVNDTLIYTNLEL